MSRHRSGNGKFAFGVIFGGLVAGVTALLFAPKKGTKLRKEISKKCCEVSEKTSDMMDGVCEQTCELVEKAKDIASAAKDMASKLRRD